jgi:hypothetical protein
METDARRGRPAARRLLDGRAVRVTGEDLLPREDEIAPCARTSYGVELAPGEALVLRRHSPPIMS